MDIEEIPSTNNGSRDFHPEDWEMREPSPEVVSHGRIFLELFTFCGAISLVASFLTVFTILKYKKLRQNTTYMIIVHLNVIEALYSLFTPLTTRVFMELQLFSPIHFKMYCSLNEIEGALFAAIALQLIILVCDWYIKTYASVNAYTNFCRVYKYVLGILYLFIFVSVSVTTAYCFNDDNPFTVQLITAIEFAGVVLLMIVMNIVHLFKRRKLQDPNITHTGLVLVNIFLAEWIPTVFLGILSLFGIQSHMLMVIFGALAFTFPVWCLLYLFLVHNHFRSFFRQVIRCRCNEYKNETLDDQPVTYNDSNGVNI